MSEFRAERQTLGGQAERVSLLPQSLDLVQLALHVDVRLFQATLPYAARQCVGARAVRLKLAADCEQVFACRRQVGQRGHTHDLDALRRIVHRNRAGLDHPVQRNFDVALGSLDLHCRQHEEFALAVRHTSSPPTLTANRPHRV